MLLRASLKEIFDYCFVAIGAEGNKDVYRYLHERPNLITRQSFFERVVWAIWVSGMRRTSTRTFLDRAEEAEFPFEFDIASSWSEKRQFHFMANLHGYPIPPRAEQKWMAIFKIAKRINHFLSEDSFRAEFFGGKSRSAELDKTDISRLGLLHLPFIRDANAHYIVRGLGGEAIKCDRWIKSFLNWYPITLNNLESEVQNLAIPLGLFDLVIWCYCEEFVGRVSSFENYFDKEFCKYAA